MRRTLLVAQREYATVARTRAFIVTLLVLPIAIAISIASSVLFRPPTSSAYMLVDQAGGRYGAATVKFNEIRHHTQVIEGIYAAIHTDLEIPWGRCTYLAGIRGEYGFTWSNIFDRGQGDLQDLTALFNLGVRY